MLVAFFEGEIENFNKICTFLFIFQSEAEGCSLIQMLNSYDYQSEIILKTAAECAAGRPGSTLFMSKPSSGRGGRHRSSVPQLFYIKVHFNLLND